METDPFPDLSADAARQLLDPLNDRIIAAITEGIRKFNLIPPEALLVLSKSKRVRANCIWAFIVAEVEALFGDAPKVRLLWRYGSLEIHVGDNLTARFKKMQPSGFTSNYMTDRVADYHTSDQGELFPHLWSRPLRVDIGYIEDATGLHVAEIKIARRLAPRVMDWVYPLDLPGADVQPIPAAPAPAPVPIPITNPQSATMPYEDSATRVIARVAEPKTETHGAD